ncbi:type VI secretion system protein TssA [Chelatococcus sp. GCM10030263]|uniref:type VI secretion system protein TssA n=1 Tax=Chelatococcus sp. GCM10030263 TaxID=3273387 RepID=UPI00362221BF
MTTPPTIDLDLLLRPIPGACAAGVDLRSDAALAALYHDLRDARAAARGAERRAIHDGDDGGIARSWRTVADQASLALAEYSKDLEIAAWLTEALLRLHGFAGLRDGFRVIEGLVRHYWEPLHPQPDEDGLSARLAPIAGLNGEGGEGTLIAPIRLVPLVSGDAGSFAFWHYERAAKMERITPVARKEAALAEAGFSLSTIEACLRAMPAEVAASLFADVAAAREAVAAAAGALDEAAGAEAPPARQILDILDEVKEALRGLGFDRGAIAGSPAADETAPADGASASWDGRGAGYASRNEAIAEVLAIASYLRRIEPHSPISYTLEEAVRRANLSLLELLPELVPDRDARRQFLTAAGIHFVESDED